ncbi:hypothetical protein Bbelb_109570 [Branchiostoma belcheri]|nr:hypothetical protein Bbelb_109570 [Branchiostoma belcheri]
MDKGLMTSVVLLDYSAAFDLVDHTLLLKKLAVYGFSADALSWIQSYLSDRNWQVYANGAYSQTRVLQCGVPQGSCLGPQLYSIYVNDMAGTVENGELDQYADDSTVHTAGHTVQDIKAKALVDLECVAKWSDYNRLKLNNGKTKTMLVGTSRKTRLAPALQLELRGQSLEQVPTVKLLGVHVDQSLTFDDHIDHVVKKCNRCMAQVGRVRKSLPRKQRAALMQALFSVGKYVREEHKAAASDTKQSCEACPRMQQIHKQGRFAADVGVVAREREDSTERPFDFSQNDGEQTACFPV